jgi:preprotein translocase subunit SecE
MENNQKWINLSYLAAAALIGLVAFLLATKFAVFLDFEGRIRSLDQVIKVGSFVLAGLVFLVLYKSSVVNVFMNQVASELVKVTWPTQDETLKASIFVIIAVVIAGVALWFVDIVWIWMLSFVL